MKNKQPIYCPIPEAIQELPFDYAEIEPLLAYLHDNQSTENSVTFQRGTITNFGQLDCCKQDLGAAGAALLSEALKDNQYITSILFGTGGIGNDGAKSVGELIENNGNIETVYLGCNRIEADGIDYLTNALKQNNSVKALWLKRNPIGNEGALKIAELLKINPNIRTLDLVNTQIDTIGLSAIIDVLIQQNYPIKRFYLSGNNLQPKDGKLLQSLLLNNSNIEELLLSVNNLGDVGVEFLAEGLRQNTTLKNLSLASNNISTQSGIVLMKALENHPNLLNLDLGYSRSSKVLNGKANRFDDDFAIAFQQFLTKNTTLRFLDLSRNQFTKKGIKAITIGLENNKYLQKITLGKGFQKRTKQQINDLLAQNRIENPFHFPVSNDVRIIKSNYR